MESNQTIPITMDFKVLVGCMTYNHSKYIVDALNGFAMQQTNFPFACIVIDDASTDGEPEVIKDWLQKECDMANAESYDLELANVIIVSHRVNANCTMAVYFLKRNLFNEENLKFGLVQGWTGHCEYIALCEGDDFWIDSSKLQKQAKSLDEHLNIDICLHSYKENKDKRYAIYHSYSSKECIIPLKQLIQYLNFFPAAGSIFIRSNILTQIPKCLLHFLTDYSIIMWGSLGGGAYYIPDMMSTYRTGIKNSITSIMKKDVSFRNNFYCKEIQMLNTLDEYLNYKYHNIILSRILLDSTPYTNSAFKNIKNLFIYKKGLKELPFIAKIKVILRCITPKMGLLLMNYINSNRMNRQKTR